MIRRLRHYVQVLSLTLIAYCLLPTHYHLLIRQDGETAAGLLPQRIFNSYSKAFNRRYRRSGTLFEGPYRAIQVVDPDYLVQLCCYIHTNLLRHGLARDLKAWPYSNYHEWAGLRNGSLWDPAVRAAHFPSGRAYTDYVADCLQGRPPAVGGAECG